MIWLAAALVASLSGVWFTWSRGLKGPALLLVVLTLALVFLLGRRIESARDGDWREVASQIGGSFRPQPGAAFLAQFGANAPWRSWSGDGELQCPRAIEGSDAAGPFALLQIRYSVRQRRGEEQPDEWYEVSVAALRIPRGTAGGALTQLAAGEGHTAAHDGEWLFVWRRGARGAGEPLQAQELAGLLERARALLRQLSPAGPPGSSATPAGPAPAGRRTPP